MNRRDLYSKESFREDSLPKNRKEVFFDILRLHYFSLMKIGLILFAFAVPLFAICFFKDYSFIIAHENGTNNGNIIVICSVIEAFLILLLAVPVSGFGKILREFAWLEPVFFGSDFKSGIKDNIKPTMISALIIAILNLIFNIVYYFSASGWFVAIPFGFNVAVFFPILMHTIFINFIYTNKYWVNFKLGMFFYFKHLPTTFLSTFLIVMFKIYDLFQFANLIAILTKYLVFLVFIIFILPIILIGTQLNELRIFDKHINSVRFPDLVNKGIYVKKDENDDLNKNDNN